MQKSKSFGESTGVIVGQQTTLVQRLKKLKKILEDTNTSAEEKVKKGLEIIHEEKRI